LVGCGSSWNALLAALPSFEAAGQGKASLRGPTQFIAALDGGQVLYPNVVVVSQSGRSRTSVAACRAAVAAGLPCTAITMNPDAPIGTTGARLLVLRIGPEPIGPKTKGFTATVAALLALSGSLAECSARNLAPLVETARLQANVLAPGLNDADWIMVCGEGAMLGIAQEASLKISEISGVPAAAFSCEEALHGRLHGLTRRSLAIFLAADANAVHNGQAVAAAMRKRAARVVLVNLTATATPDDWWQADCPPELAPIAAILPFQWLAVALATVRGAVPEAMRYPGLSADLDIKLATGPEG
jgi:glucosamine--fructose-6-phosphate aminotransferase (isomerizing)